MTPSASRSASETILAHPSVAEAEACATHNREARMTPGATGEVYVALSAGMQMMRHLDRFLDLPIVYRPRRPPAGAQAVLGWGLKGKSLRAVEYAKRVGLPYVSLEDGFLRSVDLGDIDGPLSLVFDDMGIYYNAHAPSRLESLIAAGCDPSEHARAQHLMHAWCNGRLSKYNHARERPAPVEGPYVLVVDQTFGDASIAYGLAEASSFARMLEAALDEHPGLPVVLKVHPDVIAGRKRAHFEAMQAGAASRVTLLASDAHAPGLLERAASVYVVTSQMGFEALLWRRPVRCFGMPFYAGWGLTTDELAAPERRRGAGPLELEALAHAALVTYPRYLDPETFERCQPERVFEWMALQRRMRERFPQRVQAIGFSKWKRPIARAFFAGSELQFLERAHAGDVTVPRAVWGRPAAAQIADEGAAAPIRVEDGFLRSVGLGANRVRPLSWVMDRRGIYYDASAPSDMEEILQHASWDAALLRRARALRERIVNAGITKYNVGTGGWQRPDGVGRVVLVPGQVEDDASITYGASGLTRNMDLLRAVRAADPDAYLVYRPHPDVVARRRRGGVDERHASRWCDELVADVPMQRLLQAVDEVQVLTSLAGFEALLRGRKVVCHGRPFYAGWGLTDDRLPLPRRSRRLSLDELVAGALILYPCYVSRASGRFTTPERALTELEHWHEPSRPAEALMLRLMRMLKRQRDRFRRG